MAVLVDPPSRDSADERPPAKTSAPREPGAVEAVAGSASPGPDTRPRISPEPAPEQPGLLDPSAAALELPEQKLAEPPLTGGHVEALMGRLIKVLSHSRLARPLPAVLLSALGLAGVAFNGLCAT